MQRDPVDSCSEFGGPSLNVFNRCVFSRSKALRRVEEEDGEPTATNDVKRLRTQTRNKTVLANAVFAFRIN
jgi:hypothetical protein